MSVSRLATSLCTHAYVAGPPSLGPLAWALGLLELLSLRVAKQIESTGFRLLVDAGVLLIHVRAGYSVVPQGLLPPSATIALLFEPSDGPRQV